MNREIDTHFNETYFYKNPLGISQIGDPFIVKGHDGLYYLYATSDASYGFEAWVSEDMTDWNKHPKYVYNSTKDTWGVGDFWAPEVYYYEGQYYMYYSAKWRETGTLRIGLAISDSPLGPFVDVDEKPLFDFGYAVIDANVLFDGDENYLYFSKDCSENKVANRNESHTYGIPLSKDGKTVVGEPTLLIQPEQQWELASGDWRWNEGPFVFKHQDTYYMTYSANFYASKDYSVGYAISTSPLGPFTKYESNPLLFAPENQNEISGPGHNMLLKINENGDFYNVYHTHTTPVIGGGDRSLNVDLIRIREDGSMITNGPTTDYLLKPIYLEKAIELQNQWTITRDEKKKTVTIDLAEPTKINGLMIYTKGYEAFQGLELVFSNETKITSEPSVMGDASIIYGFDAMDVTWIEMKIGGEDIAIEGISIEDIMIY